MQRWEYKILTAAYPTVPHGVHIVKYINGQEIPNWKQRKWWINKALNELGQEGWELVEVIWRQWGESMAGVSDTVYILKRALDEDTRETLRETSTEEALRRAGSPPQG